MGEPPLSVHLNQRTVPLVWTEIEKKQVLHFVIPPVGIMNELLFLNDRRIKLLKGYLAVQC